MTQVHCWIVCDANSVVIKDGMYRSKYGWSNLPEGPLPPSRQCVRIEIEVAAQGGDPNPRVSAIVTFSLDDNHEKTTHHPSLTNRQQSLLKQYINEEIPPYMLKMGGQTVVTAFFAGAAIDASPRPRKQHRPQNPSEQSLAFTCKVCDKGGTTATVGGIALRRTVGVWCRDCSAMLCTDCQRTKVGETARIGGVLGSMVENLGRSYPYEEWYGQECQFCASPYEMDMVFASS